MCNKLIANREARCQDMRVQQRTIQTRIQAVILPNPSYVIGFLNAALKKFSFLIDKSFFKMLMSSLERWSICQSFLQNNILTYSYAVCNMTVVQNKN